MVKSGRARANKADAVSAVLAIVLAAGAGVLGASQLWAGSLALAVAAIGCAFRTLQRLTAPAEVTVVSAWDRVRTEIERARRLNSALVVARVPVRPSVAGSVQDLAEQAESVLRGSDSVWTEGRSILVLLADADREAAQHGIDRVLRRLDDRASDSVVASFPGDELTLGGIFDRLYPPRRVRPLSPRAGRPAEVTVLSVDDEQHAVG